ncbi:hypothetical protein NO976_02571 [Planktothrix agardhii]|jgi:hypothetical protein|uniref:hypothetical protein n=1 Tax=Planktothrix agardhii TaxID=1160 RepID=UPI0020A73010|nr:hypothetical protein [Planktothrix agardhii]CAD5950251.1 hypothetical protein NO976_02571 [Planktothrix agardhii]
MLLPFLILAVRLLFFTLSLGAAAILGSVIIFVPIIKYIWIPLIVIVVPPVVTAHLHKNFLNWLDSLKLPNWFPGKKYLDWRRAVRKVQAKKYWLTWVKHPASFQEGFDAFSALLIAGFFALMAALLAYGLESDGQRVFDNPVEMIVTNFVGWTYIFYALDTVNRWKLNQGKWKKLSGKIRQAKEEALNKEVRDLKQRVFTEGGYLTKPEFSIGEKHNSLKATAKACEPYFTTEDFYDFAVFQWKHHQEEIPPEVKIPPEWKGFRELADVVWFNHCWGEDSPIKKATNQVQKQYPQYQASIVQSNLYKGFIALVKQRKIPSPDGWNKQTPKDVKFNWSEAEVRYEWILLKNS